MKPMLMVKVHRHSEESCIVISMVLINASEVSGGND